MGLVRLVSGTMQAMAEFHKNGLHMCSEKEAYQFTWAYTKMVATIVNDAANEAHRKYSSDGH